MSAPSAAREKLPRPIRHVAEVRQRDATALPADELTREIAAFEARLRDWAAQLESIEGGGPATVAVEVPVYKGGWLMPCIESVLFQTSTCWSLWLRWDSGDAVARRVLEIVDGLKHPRLHVYFGENRGIAYNRRFLTEHSEGEYVLPLDDDDMLAPEAVEKFLGCARERPWSGIIRARRDFIDEIGNPVDSEPWFPFETRQFQHGALCDVFNHSQPTLMSRAAYRRTDGWEGFADFRSAGEDCDVFIKVEEVAPIELFDETLYSYRLSDRRTSLVLTDEAAFEMWRRLADKAIARIGLPVRRASERPPFVYERIERPEPAPEQIDFVIGHIADEPGVAVTREALIAAGVNAGSIHVATGTSRPAALNSGFQSTTRPFVCFLIAGVVIDGDVLAALQRAMREHDADAVSPRVVHADGAVETAAPGFDQRRHPVAQVADPGATSAVGWLPASALLVRREVVKATGGFEDVYGDSYCADADFTLKARAREFRCVYVGALQVVSGAGPRAGATEDMTSWFAGRWREYEHLLTPLAPAAAAVPPSDTPAAVVELPAEFSSDDYQVEFHAAHAALAADRLDVAEAGFRRTLALAPAFGWAHYGLGDALARQGRWSESAEAFQQAVAHNPDEPWGYHHLGNALSKLERWADAVTAYQRSLAIDPNITSTARRLGFALFHLRQWEAATTVLQTFLDRTPDDFWALYCLGEALTHLERWEAAEAALRAAVAIDAQSFWAHQHLGNAMTKLERWEDAVAVYRRAIALDPSKASAYTNLGQVLRHLERFEEAIEACRQALAIDPSDAAGHIALGEVFFGLQQWSDSVAAYERALVLAPNAAGLHANLGHALFRMGRKSDAVNAYARAVELAPDEVAFHRNLGLALSEVGRLNDAVDALRRAIALDGSDAPWHVILGNTLFRLKRWSEAADAYEHAIALAPDVSMSYGNLANCRYEMGRFDDAVRFYRRAIEAQPQVAAAYLNLGTALLKLGRLEEAIEEYDRVLALSPDTFWALHQKGDALVKCGRQQEALAPLQRACELMPEFCWSHQFLADALSGLERWEEAAAAYQRSAELEPTMWWSHNNQGEMLVRLGRWDEAIAAFERAIAVQPGLSVAHRNLGDALSRAGRYTDAMTAYSNADGLAPEWARRSTGAGVAHLQAWIEKLAGEPPRQSADAGRLLFVLDNDYGELTTIMYLLLGQSLAARATLLLPPRLYASNANVLPGRTQVYSSKQDVLRAVAEQDPEVVFLCAGYLFSIHDIFALDDLRELVTTLQAEGRPLATMDPFLGLLSDIGGGTRISIHIPEHAPPQLVRVKEEQDRRLIHNFSRSYEILKDLPHLYPSHPARPGAEPASGCLSFFNPVLTHPPLAAAQSAAASNSEPPQWLFVLASRDYEVQMMFNGREWVMDLLTNRLEETIAAGRHPVFIGPYDCIQALVRHFESTGSDVVRHGATLLTFCSFPKYSALLLNAEYAFYWNSVSHSMFLRLFNGLPVFQFDRGHLVRNVTPLYERIVDWYYQGWTPVFLEQDEALDREALARAAAAYREGARRVAPHFRRAPSPEVLVESLRVPRSPDGQPQAAVAAAEESSAMPSSSAV